MSSENRRKDFRVDISLHCRWEALTEEEVKLLKRGMGRSLFEKNECDSPIDEIMRQTVPGSQEEHWYRSLQLINNKLDFIIDQIFLESSELPMKRDKVIELSGSGVKFVSHRNIQPGTFLRMLLILPGTFLFQIELIGEVMRIERKGEAAVAAARIVEIDEAARDAIITVVFQKQRQEIRREKLNQGGAIDS